MRPNEAAHQTEQAARPDARATVFADLRPLLFAIAYRMLGSVADAEDLVQDTYLRWHDAAETEIRDPRAWLSTIVTRLAINRLRSARAQRESYVGPWLPEPLVTEDVPDPTQSIELAESLSTAFLLMLERLSPIERAVLLLHDAFDFDYAEIARIIGKSEANCRQLLSRAKKHLGAPRPRFDSDPEEADRLLALFTHAVSTGDLEGIVSVLSEEVSLYTDSGGKVRGAARQPLHGRSSVGRFIAGSVNRAGLSEQTVVRTRINEQPGLLVYANDGRFAAMVFEISEHLIQTIYVIANPEKLRGVPPTP